MNPRNRYRVMAALWGSLLSCGRLSIGMPRLQPAGGGSRGALWVARRLSNCPTIMVFTTAILLLLAGHALAAAATAEIKVDQVGYPTAAPKVAFVAAKNAPAEFTVRRAGDGGVAFRAALAPPVDDPDSGDRVQAADFSKLTASGKYYVEIAGVGRSWQFAIGPEVYGRAWYLAMRSYYGQRCGAAVDLGPEFPGFKHEACHLEGAWHPSSGKNGARASRSEERRVG